jgi:hypothetical protein
MKRIAIVLTVSSLIFLGGCDTGTRQRLNCICLIDYSGSLSEETVHQYVRTISSDVLGRMREKDRLVVLPIDEGAKTKAVKLVLDDFSEKQFSFHTDGYTHASDSLRLRLRQYAQAERPVVAATLLREKGVRQQFTYFTDIFAALQQAAELLERNEPETFWESVGRFVSGKKKVVSTNVIILFSDMMQESVETSFAGPEGCTAEQADSLLQKLRTSGGIPDLRGCRVFVNGRTGKTNLQVDNIKNFWSSYFRESGVDLVAYDYDAGPQIIAFLDQR